MDRSHYSQQRASIFSVIVDFFKGTATILSSMVKILFAIVGVLFLLTVVESIASGAEHAQTYREVLYSGSEETIAVIDLSGTILDVVPQGPFDIVTETQLITPRRVLKITEELKNDPTVVGVVIRINSPGGSVTASEEIYQTIQRFKKETGLPVIVSQGEIAASGGYYISLAGDTIMADATTLTGSIGVIASLLNFQELANEYGVKEIAITSGENKNFFSPFQEVDESEHVILETIINEAYVQFLSRIRESRSVSESALTTLADGRPLTGAQAADANLVDSLGTFYDAIQVARTESGYTNAQVVEYSGQGVFESLFGVVAKPLVSKVPFSFLNPYTQLTGKPAYLYGGM